MSAPMFYKPNIKKRILWILIILLAVCCILFPAYYVIVHHPANQKHTVPSTDSPQVSTANFTLDPGVSYQHAVSQSMLFFYSSENIKIINAKGELKQEFSLKIAQPAISTRGTYALFYDINGKNAFLFNGSKQERELNLDSKILIAHVNSSGYSLLVTEGDMHKCAVSVYNTNGEEIFKWNSGGLSVVAADISDNNKEITISAINTDSEKIENSIIMFNITKEKPFTNDKYEDELFSVVKYSGSSTYCIGVNKTLIYNNYGKLAGSTDYNDRELLTYALDEHLLVLAFSGSGQSSGAMELKSYNRKAEETGAFTSEQSIDFLDCKGDNIVINNGRKISVLNNRCREKYQMNMGVDLRDFMFFGNDSHGIGVTATGAELIKLGL